MPDVSSPEQRPGAVWREPQRAGGLLDRARGRVALGGPRRDGYLTARRVAVNGGIGCVFSRGPQGVVVQLDQDLGL
ncbi:hypothetical protein ACO229_23530 [Promicromonospora sp. MS192]|uniref:hypothetical protein n=1 Tax=Promicromonospora sp. MS192 TaxID=3412684 RepID=UPI003C2C54D1